MACYCVAEYVSIAIITDCQSWRRRKNCEERLLFTTANTGNGHMHFKVKMLLSIYYEDTVSFKGLDDWILTENFLDAEIWTVNRKLLLA